MIDSSNNLDMSHQPLRQPNHKLNQAISSTQIQRSQSPLRTKSQEHQNRSGYNNQQ